MAVPIALKDLIDLEGGSTKPAARWWWPAKPPARPVTGDPGAAA